jgi:hypothetical protein
MRHRSCLDDVLHVLIPPDELNLVRVGLDAGLDLNVDRHQTGCRGRYSV